MKAVLKEKVQSAPKELTRRGLDSGVDRLRTQLQDTAQAGQRDGYGGNAIEDAAADGLRRGEHGVERLLKKKKSQHSAPETPETGQERPLIKTREAAQQASHAPAEGRSGMASTQPNQLTRRANEAIQPTPAAPTSGGTGQASIKTKDAYIHGQAITPAAQPPPAQAQGRREFVREQGRAAAKQIHVGRERVEQPNPAGRDVLLRQRSGAPLKTVRGIGSAHTPHIKPSPTIRPGRPGARTVGRPTRQTVKTVEHSAARSAGTATQNAKRATEAGRQITRARKAAKTAQTTAKRAAQAAGRALRAVAAAAKSLVKALMAGGWVVVVIVLLICLVGMLVASPFGVFFSGEDSGSGYTMPEAVVLLNSEFTNKIEQIKADNPHDVLDLDNAGSAAMISNWDDVLAIYAVRTATDDTTPEEVATLTEQKLSILRGIFWDMNAISYWMEVIPGGEDESDTTVLHITVTIKNHSQMADEYGFTPEQRALLEEMMGPKYAELFMRLTGSYQDMALSPAEVREIMERLPPNLSEERKQVVLTAYQLLGKVNYFWGGKSLVLGWDSRWGTPMEVRADGSSTTGSMRPFGLDCSGYVDWVFYNMTGGEYVIGQGGGASAQHGACTDVTWDEAIPGDLVFYPGDSHVGIVCGFDESGNVQIIHCASSYNNVVVTGKSGFTSIARPAFYIGSS